MLVLVALLGACANAGGVTTTVERAEPPSPSTTTPSTLPATTAPGTTLSATTTTLQTPRIHLYGLEKLYSTDGVVLLEGTAVGATFVSANGNTAQTWSAGEQTGFSVELVLDPGEHEIEILATSESGAEAAQLVLVVVDPGLELRIGYLTEVDAENGTIVADYVEWLTGEEALAAAREDGAIGQDEDLPGDFYIRNRNPELRTLDLSDDPVIVLQACYPDDGPCLVRQAVDTATFDGLFADPENGYELVGWWWYGTGHLPYWLTLDNGTVVQISEQYLP